MLCFFKDELSSPPYSSNRFDMKLLCSEADTLLDIIMEPLLFCWFFEYDQFSRKVFKYKKWPFLTFKKLTWFDWRIHLRSQKIQVFQKKQLVRCDIIMEPLFQWQNFEKIIFSKTSRIEKMIVLGIFNIPMNCLSGCASLFSSGKRFLETFPISSQSCEI